MKIKCPFCKDTIDKSMTYYDHWCDMAEFDEAGKMLSDILSKIYEKIEVFTYLQKDRRTVDFVNDEIIRVLKSLLEDKK